MKVSYRWLSQYVEIPWTPQELADKLTMAGLEVESVDSLDPGLKDVLVGEVVDVKDHPNADLTICQVQIGKDRLQVVCGAPNVRLGLRAPFAPAGSVLPGGHTIGRAELRGITSEGMLCSEKELQLGEDGSGLLELPAHLDSGQCLVQALGLDDTVLDVAVYANRPDCMSMHGIAREVSVLTREPVTVLEPCVPEIETSARTLASVVVEDEELCPRYSARVLTNVQIGASPLWMQQRLRAAGMRPINNIVDITNYVMLETGHPLHAFDYDKVADKQIVVRRAHPGELLTTLDGEQRKLTPDMLLICDGQGPACIAGVMGGASTEVTEGTSSILLEAASFSPASIRRTSRNLGLLSEASSRFEKGVHPQGTIDALDRAAKLLIDYAQGQVAAGVLDQGHTEYPRQTISLRPQRVNDLLGADIETDVMQQILTGLGLEVRTQAIAGSWEVDVPPYRQDLERECDLVEEIARHFGFDRIPSSVPRLGSVPGGQTDMLRIGDELRSVLVGCGLHETVNYSFEHRRNLERMGLTDEWMQRVISLQNPISEEMEIMRPALLPGLLETARRNLQKQQSRISMFEIGSVYGRGADDASCCEERQKLAIVLVGQRSQTHWDMEQLDYDFFDIKGILELCAQVFLGSVRWEASSLPFLHPGRQGQLATAKGVIGNFGELHPDTTKAFRLSGRVYVAELEIAGLGEHLHTTVQFQPWPKFPAIYRDVALVVDATVPVTKIKDLLHNAGGPLLREVVLFDVYQGDQLEAGKKSAAFSLVFQGDKTLTDAAVDQIMGGILQAAEEELQAQIR